MQLDRGVGVGAEGREDGGVEKLNKEPSVHVENASHCHIYFLECRLQCSHPAPTVWLEPNELPCHFLLPDNPDAFSPHPCELRLRTNCSSVIECQLQLQFERFERPSCPDDIKLSTETCQQAALWVNLMKKAV